jgi:hypothetical protein
VSGHSYRLADAEQRALGSPRSFQIPTRAERYGLRPFDYAKVVFLLEKAPIGGPHGERMWLQVVDVLGGGKYRGELANQSVDFPHFKLGDAFEFEARHVCSIQRAEYPR